MSLRLMIFEDNEVLRQSLVTILVHDGQAEVVGDFGNALEAKAAVHSLRPDAIIMDIDMPGIDGIAAVRGIKELHPEIPIIMYTQFEDEEKLFASLCAGADGYLLKKTSPLRLFEAIQDALAGGAPMSPSIAKKVLHSFRTHSVPFEIRYQLTAREQEILKLLTQGYSVKGIAHDLGIAFETTRSHLRNIYRKLHVNCGKEAIAKVLADKIS